MQAVDFVGVEFDLDAVPVGQMNVGVVTFGFSNICNLINKGNCSFKIFELEFTNKFFVFCHLPVRGNLSLEGLDLGWGEGGGTDLTRNTMGLI